jgi:hypothetical protein
MRKLITIGLLLALNLMPTTTYAQWKNNVWLWGARHNDLSSPWYGGTKLLFENDTAIVAEELGMKMNLVGTYSVLITPNDNYFVYTNG